VIWQNYIQVKFVLNYKLGIYVGKHQSTQKMSVLPCSNLVGIHMVNRAKEVMHAWGL